MGIPLAYLYLTLTDANGEGQVKVMHVSTEAGHYTSDFRKMFPKITKETTFPFTLQLRVLLRHLLT